MHVPRWAGSPFTLGVTRCQILWFRVLAAAGLAGLLAACSLARPESEAVSREPTASRPEDVGFEPKGTHLALSPGRGVPEDESRPREDDTLLLEFYAVDDILGDPPEYPAPRHIRPPYDYGGGEASSATGGVLEFEDDDTVETKIWKEKLLELIESKLDDPFAHGSVELWAGVLIVRQPLSEHRKLALLLNALRRTLAPSKALQPEAGSH
jgi:hypothetical protein